MAEFSINMANINSTSSELNGCANQLKAMSAEVLQIRSSLSLKIAQTSNIKARLKRVSDAMIEEKNGTISMSNAIQQVVSEYKKTELRVTTRTSSIGSFSILRRSGIIAATSISKEIVRNSIIGIVIGTAGSTIWDKFRDWLSTIIKVEGKPAGTSENSQTSTRDEKTTVQQSTTVQPSLESTASVSQNVNYGTPKGNANGYHMTYYGQGSYAQDYDKNNFVSSSGIDYSGKSSLCCGICCEAMILSYFGADVKPGDLLAANGGSASWDASGVKNKLKEYGVKMNIVAQKSKGNTSEQLASALDSALDNFVSNPNTNGPVMVSTNLGSNGGNHYVLVVGKDADGKYIIVDPGTSKRTTTTLDHIKMVVTTTKS